jgi:hypothetical protein
MLVEPVQRGLFQSHSLVPLIYRLVVKRHNTFSMALSSPDILVSFFLKVYQAELIHSQYETHERMLTKGVWETMGGGCL